MNQEQQKPASCARKIETIAQELAEEMNRTDRYHHTVCVEKGVPVSGLDTLLHELWAVEIYAKHESHRTFVNERMKNRDWEREGVKPFNRTLLREAREYISSHDLNQAYFFRRLQFYYHSPNV